MALQFATPRLAAAVLAVVHLLTPSSCMVPENLTIINSLRDFKPLLLGGDLEYFVSNKPATVEEAEVVCESIGPNFHLVSFENETEYERLLPYLRSLEIPKLWTAGAKYQGPDSTSRYVWTQPSPIIPMNFINFPSKSAKLKFKQKDYRCRNGFRVPKCNAPKCHVTLKPCTISTPDCEITNQKDCSCHREDCVASCNNCTVISPVCHAIQPKCDVKTPKCEVTKPVCKIVTGECEVTRPDCVQGPADCVPDPTHKPCPSKPTCVTNPHCTTTRPPCSNGKCPPPTTTCKPVIDCTPIICTEPPIICKDPAIICPPEVIVCKPPEVLCSQPVINCGDPIVNCTKPEWRCIPPRPIVKCSAPEISCPSTVVNCPLPSYTCPSPHVDCPPPEVTCDPVDEPPCPTLPPCHEESDTCLPCEENDDDDYEYEEEVPNHASEESPEIEVPIVPPADCDDCLDNGCIALRKETDFKWKLQSCTDRLHFVCEGR